MDVQQFTRSSFQLALEEDTIVKIGKNYFYSGPQLKELRSKINRDIFAIGMFLGSDSGKYFEPSPGLIEMLSKMPGAEKYKIYIGEKSEQLFLYGRNILREGVSRNPNNLGYGYVFVQNEHDENLGYGIFHQQGPDLVIKNLLDKGFYLRKEQKKKKH
jgi:ribosome biogenesis protein Nip4